MTEIVSERPADDWFFVRFAPFRRSSPEQTVREVLLAHARNCSEVFRRLSESRSLDRVLSFLDRATTKRLWSEGVSGQSPSIPDAMRPVFAAALGAVVQLGGAAPDRAQAEVWFTEFLAGFCSPLDWRDKTSLAQAVFAAIQFVLARVSLPRPATSATIEAAVAGLDWLDVAWLKPRLLERTAQPLHAGHLPAPVFSRHGATPRQRQWLEILARALPQIIASLDHTELCSSRNLLLIFAIVKESLPPAGNSPAVGGLGDDPALAGFLELLLKAADVVCQLGWPHEREQAHHTENQPVASPPLVQAVRASANRRFPWFASWPADRRRPMTLT